MKNFILALMALITPTLLLASACPLQKVSVQISCDPATNLIRFAQHSGVYSFHSEYGFVNNQGQSTLVCEYHPEVWMSDYSISGAYSRAKSVEQLQEILGWAPDLTPDETTKLHLSAPIVRLVYRNVWWKFSPSLQSVYADLGLGRIDPTSRDPKRLVLILDQNAYDAGEGGGYYLGSNCKVKTSN